MNQPEHETFSRFQILSLMGITAISLLLIAKIWQLFGRIILIPVTVNLSAIGMGISIAVGITVMSAILYQVWANYRHSADRYLSLVIKPLEWLDIIWLGLLPGLSEEFLFRGVMLSAFGENGLGLIVSSIVFGVLHYSGEGQFPYMVWATIVGFLLGWAALSSGNLCVPIIAHICTNWFSGLIWKYRLQSR